MAVGYSSVNERGNMRFLLFLFLGLSPILFFQTTQARTFKNAYISFEMVDTWRCKLEQTEWVCRSEDPQESKEAVIILTAKERGPTDSFPIYYDHMNKPMTLNLKTGGTGLSTITIPPKELAVNDQKWLDSLHVNSEVQSYYTRYLSTIKDDIAILVTFSVHNKYYAKHSGNFMNTVKSLKVIAPKDLTSNPSAGPLHGAGETLGSSINGAMPSDLLASDDGMESGSNGKGPFDNKLFLGFIIVVLAIIGYVGFKMMSKK